MKQPWPQIEHAASLPSPLRSINRGYPYDRTQVGLRSSGRGRTSGGRGARPKSSQSYRNRTLVMNRGSQTQTLGQSLLNSSDITMDDQAARLATNGPSLSTTSWVSRRDRHAQLINSSIYDKDFRQRHKAIEQTRQHQASGKDQREKLKIVQHLQAIAHKAVLAPAAQIRNTSPHEIMISDLRFEVQSGGSKLLRIRSKLR